MDKETALSIWTTLEQLEARVDGDEDGEAFDFPVFAVRLDAVDVDGIERDYRVRVKATGPGVGTEWWSEVLDAARDVENFEVQNNGIELS